MIPLVKINDWERAQFLLQSVDDGNLDFHFHYRHFMQQSSSRRTSHAHQGYVTHLVIHGAPANEGR